MKCKKNLNPNKFYNLFHIKYIFYLLNLSSNPQDKCLNKFSLVKRNPLHILYTRYSSHQNISNMKSHNENIYQFLDKSIQDIKGYRYHLVRECIHLDNLDKIIVSRNKFNKKKYIDRKTLSPKMQNLDFVTRTITLFNIQIILWNKELLNLVKFHKLCIRLDYYQNKLYNHRDTEHKYYHHLLRKNLILSIHLHICLVLDKVHFDMMYSLRRFLDKFYSQHNFHIFWLK